MADKGLVTSKPWYQSIVIWAGYAVIALQAVPAFLLWADSSFGLHLSTQPAVMSVLSVIAAIVAIYGRFTAKATIQ